MRMIKQNKGFTLVEMLLVLVVISMIILMSIGYLQQRTVNMRMDRVVMQMQQILNASLSFYVANGHWPDTVGCLQGMGSLTLTTCTTKYLPAEMLSPFGTGYELYSNTQKSTVPAGVVYVSLDVRTESSTNASNMANIIAGRLPLSYTTISHNTGTKRGLPPPNDQSCPIDPPQNQCTVVASVNIPGQNLNNASAVNYTGIYHSGACVPVPQCPVDNKGVTMTPEIIVAPVSVTGANDEPSGTPCSSTDVSGCQLNAYPISSFSAYTTPPETTPKDCGLKIAVPCEKDSTGATLPAGKYWRVCLTTTTQKGLVEPTGKFKNPWGRLQGTVLAITRCGIQNEPEGSDFTVWTAP